MFSLKSMTKLEDLTVGGLDVSLYEAAQNFEIFPNIQDQT